MITQERVRHLFEYKDGILYWRNREHLTGINGRAAGHTRCRTRTYVSIDGRRYSQHSIIYLYHHGYIPDLIDHADRDHLNNRIENLRECDRSGNAANSGPKAVGSSMYKGVARRGDGKKWVAAITKDYKSIHLGNFENEHDAAMAYDKAARELHGEFAYTNFTSAEMDAE